MCVCWEDRVCLREGKMCFKMCFSNCLRVRVCPSTCLSVIVYVSETESWSEMGKEIIVCVSGKREGG